MVSEATADGFPCADRGFNRDSPALQWPQVHKTESLPCRSSARSDETAVVAAGDRNDSAGLPTPSSSDTLELLKQAALTFQTPPAIYQRHRLGLEDLPKVGLPQPIQEPKSMHLAGIPMLCSIAEPLTEAKCRAGGRG